MVFKIKAKTMQVVNTIRLVTINDHEFRAIEVETALECLSEADNLFNTCIIETEGLGELLEALGVAFQGTKGGYRKADNYRAFCDTYKAIDERGWQIEMDSL